VTMATLSSKGRALVRAGRRALQPTDADRERLIGALNSRLGNWPCRPTWNRCRPRPLRGTFRWLGRASAFSTKHRGSARRRD
jgi:hypothetical protein